MTVFAASAAAQLTINPSLPVATEGVPYTGQFAATGGVPPYHFVLDQAVSGFQLSDGGQLTGTPPIVGGIPFLIAVTDSSMPQLNGFGSFLVDVEPPPPGPFLMTTTSLPGAKVGAAYNGQIAVSGGVPPYSFSIPIAEQVAAGIFIQVGNGTLYGTPTTPGSFPLDVTVQDHSASPQTVQGQFTVTVIPGLTLLTNYVLATGAPGQALFGSSHCINRNPAVFFCARFRSTTIRGAVERQQRSYRGYSDSRRELQLPGSGNRCKCLDRHRELDHPDKWTPPEPGSHQRSCRPSGCALSSRDVYRQRRRYSLHFGLGERIGDASSWDDL